MTEASAGRAPRVLVIDDDPSIRRLLAARLQAAGFDVRLAADGHEGLDLVGRDRPDAIVSDVLLPGRDGFEIARLVKADPSTAHVPVILLSAFYVGPDDGSHGKWSGADRYYSKADAILPKPVDGDVLVQSVRALLSGERLPPRQAGGTPRAPLALLVDDDDKNLRLLRFRLEPEGFTVRCAASAEAALALVAGERPDICLLDVQLPGIDGLEALARLRRLDPEMPIVMMTAYGSERVAVEAMKKGANDYFSKPFDPSEVVLILRACLERRRLREATRRLEQQLRETASDLWSRVEALEAANAQLAESNQRIREADRLKSDFIANMSHELRTPLNSIIGFSQLLLQGGDGTLTETMVGDVSAILSCGQHLLSMINDLLDLARIEAGRLDLHLAPVAVADLIQDVLTTGRSVLEKGAATVQCRIAEGLPPCIADRTRVQQVLLNLLANAVRHAPRGTVLITAQLESGGGQAPALPGSEGGRERRVRISVIDAGPGIRPEDQERIFERFNRVGGPGTQGGAGLGLHISRNLVELQGGKIWVSSVPGHGATFHVALPVAPELT